MKRTFAVSLALLAPLLFAGCRTPFQCTPDTCGSLATSPLPLSLHDTWRSADGSILKAQPFLQGPDLDPVPTTSLVVIVEPDRSQRVLQAFSFDGHRVFAEERLGDDPRSPRRFFRLHLERDTLELAALQPQALLASVRSEAEVHIVPSSVGPAISYRDLETTAAAIHELLGSEHGWDPPTLFRRTSQAHRDEH